MAHQVVWLLPALDDLQAIGQYISAGSPRYASIVVQDLLDAARQLADFPLMGPLVPEWSEDEYRQRIVYSYRLIYRVRPPRVEVLAVLHGARLLPETHRDRT